MSLSLHLIFSVCLRLKTLSVLNNLIPGSFLEFYCLLSTFMGYIPRFWMASVCCLPPVEPFCSEPSPVCYSCGSSSHFWVIWSTRLSTLFMVLAGFFIPIIFHTFPCVIIIRWIFLQ